jgi:hypothetical protein
MSTGIIPVWLRLRVVRLRLGVWFRLWHWLVVASTLASLTSISIAVISSSVSITTGLAAISVSTTLATLAIWFRLRVVWLRFRHRLRLGVASIYNYRFRLRRRWRRWLRLRARARVISSTLSSLARLATVSVSVISVSVISLSISVSISLGSLARLAIVYRFWLRFWLRFRFRFRLGHRLWFGKGIIPFMIWVNRVERLVSPTSRFRLGLGRWWHRLVTSTTRLASLASITTAVATLATLAAVSVTIITSMFTVSVSISTTLSTVSVSTLATLAVRFRHRLVHNWLWFWIRCWLILPVSNGIIWLRLRLWSRWRRPRWLRIIVSSTLASLARFASISVSVTTGLASIAIWFRLRVVWLWVYRLRLMSLMTLHE